MMREQDFSPGSASEGFQVEPAGAEPGSRRRSRDAFLEPFRNLLFEQMTFLRPETDESERLQVPMRTPHGKQHLGVGSHHAGPNLNRQPNLRSFFQVGRDLQHPSRYRELVQFANELSAIFQANEDGNSSLQIDPRGPCSRPHSRRIVHSQINYFIGDKAANNRLVLCIVFQSYSYALPQPRHLW